MSGLSILLSVLAAGALHAQPARPQERPSTTLSNDKLELTVRITGAALTKLVLLDDAARLSPMWSGGHFLCLDGFGTPTAEETAAGWPFHGEANRQVFEVAPANKAGAISSLKMTAKLPLAQEAVTRTMQVADGENVVYVETEVESLVGFDRPLSWAEHATVGPPFLEPGKVTIDLPGKHCQVRPEKPGNLPPRLPYGKNFDWPMAPLIKGGTVNLTEVPVGEANLDLASCQIDPAREYGYVVALQREKKLVFGYIFHREQYPWLMSWMNYTGNAQAARGMEFSTQPFDVSHRDSVDAHEMFGTPTYRWLPAKSKLRTRFLFFYAKVPSEFAAVADVVLENGVITIKDQAGRTLVLPARLGL
ncbi:MAG TPA: hypothetical protein VGH38_19390 [Bryobacteraceae bacterium]